jgi:hypothetical protein
MKGLFDFLSTLEFRFGLLNLGMPENRFSKISA